MATSNSRSYMKIPGTLVKDPTDLSAAYPYGGTELGMTTEEVFKIRAKHREITAEEWGGQTVDVIHGGTSCVFACQLRGYDNDAIAAMFTDTETVTPSQDKAIRYRVSSGRAGTLLSATAMKILFVPKARIRHRAILLWSAAPVISEDVAIACDMSREILIPVIWIGLPDATGRVAEIQRIVDMRNLI